MSSLRAALVLRGILAFIVGVVAVAWPDITIGAFVVVFAFYAFIAGGIAAAGAFRADRAGGVASGLLLALLDVTAGVAALVWPGITALALVWLVAAWAFVAGSIEVTVAFVAGGSAGQRALLGLGGLVSIALGFVFAIRPDIGAVSISQVFGLFSIVGAVSSFVVAANLGNTNVPDTRTTHNSRSAARA